MALNIHATIGPACWKGDSLESLLSSGIHSIRINMSHMNHEALSDLIKEIRQISPDISIGADIRGRKLRIGPLPKGKVTLKNGDTFILLPVKEEKMGSQSHTTVDYPNMSDVLSEGTVILLDDGALTFSVKKVFKNEVVCTVERGGELLQRSGINIPNKTINLPALTQKDYTDLDLLSKVSIDFIYLSFVETAEDIRLLRSVLKERGLTIPVIAKIELSVAVNNIEEISREADGICLARGDLGVEIPIEKIPYIQRHVVEITKKAGKPILIAGEVLYSLVNRYIPFRAELTDTVVAVEQGVDGFILSDETAIGVDPANSIKILQSLINEAERNLE